MEGSRLESRIVINKGQWTPSELEDYENKWKRSLPEKLAKGLTPYIYYEVIENDEERKITASLFVRKVIEGEMKWKNYGVYCKENVKEEKKWK